MMKDNSLGLLVLALLMALLVLSPLFAQEPPGQDIGAQAERLEEEIKEKEEGLEKKPVKAPDIKVEEKKEEKPAVSAPTFSLKGIKITGAKVFKPDDFLPLYQSYLEKKVSFDDLSVIVEKIKAKYKERGYFTAVVFLPEQDIKEGIVEIRVVEGKMGSLLIEGNKWFAANLIEQYFHTKKNDSLEFSRLQKDILRLNQNSDMEVKVVISAGKEAETSDVTLQVKDRFPWHIGLTEDSLGSRLTGKYRTVYSLRGSNLTGNLDSLFLNTVFTTRSFGQSISYRTPLDTYGTKFGLNITFFKMDLGKEYKASEIVGRTQIYTPHLLKELYLSERFQANFNLGMEIKSIRKKTAGNMTSNDQLRTPYFLFDLNKTDSFGQTTFSPRFNFGTKNFLGASSQNHPTASRAGTAGFFFKYEQSLSRLQRMPWGSYIMLGTEYQAASHTLPSSEQLQLGGMNSVRGYPEGDYLCDTGANLNFDWVFFARHPIQPVFFNDLGWGRLKKVISGEDRTKFLWGIGGGLRFRMANHAYLRLEWAKRRGNQPQGGSGPATLNVSFQVEM